MTSRRTPQISTRKEPQQARSTGLVAAILEAAVQVLAKEGAQRFTTARVAEKAGVSVGSVYQYFPNKAAILFRLQTDEWQKTSDMLRQVLEDRSLPPMARLRKLAVTFVESECVEAEMRLALSDAAPLYRDAPEAQAVKDGTAGSVAVFLQEALPGTPDEIRALACSLVTTTLGTVGKELSASGKPQADIMASAGALGDMLCAYVASLGPSR